MKGKVGDIERSVYNGSKDFGLENLDSLDV